MMECIVTNTMCGRSGIYFFLLLVSLSTIHNSANAWVAPVPTTLSARPSSWRTSAFMTTEKTESVNDNDNESDSDSNDEKVANLEAELKIARLEAELRKLKEDKATDDDDSPQESTQAEPPPKSRSFNVIEKNQEEAPTKKKDDEDEEIPEEASMDMFLSEGWKDARSSYDPKNTATVTRKTEEDSAAFGLVAKIVGGILAVVLFSQIPVGQEDLSKYSNIKSSAPKVSIDLGDINRVKGQVQNSDL